jgi:predicted homoserine dehydrogenase-like protein
MYPTLIEALRRRDPNNPVRVALVGAGRFGTTVAAQLGSMPALRLSVVCDLRSENARGAWAAYGVAADDVLAPASSGDLADAVLSGRPAIVDDVTRAAEAPVDVVVEATGLPEIACRTAIAAIDARHHVVMVTVEADVLVGPLLRRRADRAGVIYTLTDGDQPAVTKRLCDWAIALGYQIVAAGRGTRFYPDDWDGVPEEAFARYGYSQDLVERRRFNAQMYNSFRDGSKAQIEMCALANATGLVPDRRGMHEPSAGVSDLPRLFALKGDGGLLDRAGVVDLANAVGPDGKDVADHIASGVWIVLGSENPILREDLPFYGLPGAAAGRYAAFWRSFHLCGVETPLSVAEAALLGQATAAPLPTPIADVLAVAKRDLVAGERLGGSGSAELRGVVDRYEVARSESLLPLSLAYGVRLTRDVARGESIRYDAVDLDSSALAVRLRREMEEVVRQ